MTGLRIIRIALLITDTPIPEVVATHGDYHSIFNTWLTSSLAANHRDAQVEFVLDGYDVIKGDFPDPQAYDAMVITGSAASAYEDLPWIHGLTKYIRSVTEAHPRVKIIGICFGHQVVAAALGGRVEKNNGVWEAGVYNVELSQLGKQVFGAPTINIHQMHQDIVTKAPDGFQLLGSTPRASNQGMVMLHSPPSDSASSEINVHRDVHVFTIQGHPEFNSDIVNKILTKRGAAGRMSPTTVAEGRERAGKEHDGVSGIGKAVWNILAGL